MKLNPKKSKFILIFLISAIIFLVLLFFYFRNLTHTFTGQIKLETQLELSDIQIYLAGKSGSLDPSGNFTFSQIKSGPHTIEIFKPGFSPVKVEINIDTSLFPQKFFQAININLLETSSLKGKLISTDPKHEFFFDSLTLNEKKLTIQADGTFLISEISPGNYTFIFESKNFQSLSKEITLLKGENIITDIKLTPSGEIVGKLKSYLKGQIPEKVDFEINSTSIFKEPYYNSTTGEFRLEEFNEGEKINIKISVAGFVEKNYELVVNQGENTISDLILMEDLNLAIWEKEKSSFGKIYINGEIEKSILAESFTNPTKIKFLENSEEVCFINLKSPECKSFTDGSTRKILKNEIKTSEIWPSENFHKFIYLTESNNKNSLNLLEIDNDTNTEIYSTENELEVLKLTLDLNYIYLKETNKEGVTLKVLQTLSKKVKTITEIPESKLLDISEDGKEMIFTASQTSNSFQDLLLFNFETNSIKNLEKNIKGTGHKLIKNEIYFLAEKEKTKNILKMNTKNSEVTNFTNFDTNFLVKDFRQIGDLIWYQNQNSETFILDLENINFKVKLLDVKIQLDKYL